MKCENCIYRKNCQFLAKHKKAKVSGCTAFVSEADFVKKAKAEAVREFAEKLKEQAVECDVDFNYSKACHIKNIEVVEAKEIDKLVNEMFGNPEQAEGVQTS